ncbi:MAG: molybdenum cofactor guanylyltransferase [Bacteroidetes bacterium]|nr:MAG: molybdenum cofactor guanylyltransferase [Bacteroidota bacterium]REK00787.1 MAG: molybdenum cofactor guanylyltransferase [Bacteroidota bacterium]REK35035.1 MAG: molybdenum cofactor guanylyltransferase [Bacteroidota bacterium]REK48166.1 MAG: molybdenum cofactor guanylyltransferase [Bacteroidota bacterium]
MMKPSANINGVILSGGKSSRMGQTKAWIILGEKTMLEHVVDAMKQVTNEIFISANEKEFEKTGYKVIYDEVKGAGPLGGICSVLNQTQAQKLLVLSCDVPFISVEFLRYLIQNSKPGFNTVPVYMGKLEPLIAIYDKSNLQVMADCLNKGIYKLQDILKKCKTQLLLVPHDKYSFHIFDNINTPFDLSKVEQKAS